ncbi:mediator of RNA polymerase II transcription subunit 11 [Anthonomus grandis grandis]|uniref:mediator of RNA polymerase II transcription subunit 11 n=1 Tax=Anthonomus grandis grandis TaxID=2921223 RepID=UPI0021662DF5|nr:mediator of RNA polymerase II transcription subunit 11 [Anthonomus grandis grandis]
MTAPMERIHVLDSIEKDIITCLNSAGQVFLELSKEKSSLKQAENHTQTFLKTLSSVENRLTDQINYLTQVSTGQPHEGSGYASQKVLQMAWHRLEHARSRVNELEKIKLKHIQGRTAAQPQRQIQPQIQAGQNLPTSAMSVPQLQSQST